MPDPPPSPETFNSTLSALERAQQIVDIASDDGDVILILEFARLRVCSPILCSASPVFNAMLGPHFSEGQASETPQSPKEISLPDDDTFAMKRLCRLIHHQSDPLESALEEAPAAQVTEWLHKLVVVADKYCCLEAIDGVVKYELSSFATPSVSKVMSECGLLELIDCAFLLNNGRYFAYFTRCIALDGIMLYSDLIDVPPLQRLPTTLLLLADEQRSEAWRVIHLELPALSAQQCPIPGCEISASDLKFPTTLLRMPWPPNPDTSARDIIKSARSQGDVAIHLRLGCRHGSGRIQTSVPKYKIESLCRKIEELACGLCLECVKAGRRIWACKHKQRLLSWVAEDPVV